MGLGIIGHRGDPYRGPGSSIGDPRSLCNVPNPYVVAVLEEQHRDLRLRLGPFPPVDPPPRVAEDPQAKEDPQGSKEDKEHKEERPWKRGRKCEDEEPKVEHPWRRRKCNQGTQSEGLQNE